MSCAESQATETHWIETCIVCLFNFGCDGSLLLRELPLAVVSGACSLRYMVQASHFGGFSCCGARAPKHRLSSCVTQLSVSLSYTTGLFAPQHVESSWTRYQTHVPCFGRQILNHWTTREVLIFFSFMDCDWGEPFAWSGRFSPGFFLSHKFYTYSLHWSQLSISS